MPQNARCKRQRKKMKFYMKSPLSCVCQTTKGMCELGPSVGLSHGLFLSRALGVTRVRCTYLNERCMEFFLCCCCGGVGLCIVGHESLKMSGVGAGVPAVPFRSWCEKGRNTVRWGGTRRGSRPPRPPQPALTPPHDRRWVPAVLFTS